MQSNGNFKIYEAQFTALEKELGGEIILNPGRGADFMEVAWSPEPGVTFFDRIVVNPAVLGDDLQIDPIRSLFIYNEKLRQG